MLVTFDHIVGFGKITKQDFVFSNPEGTLDPKESPDDVLEKGWIPWKGKWYNHRSVRINLKNFYPSKSTKKDLNKIEVKFNSIDELKDFSNIEKIYNIYCDKNNFIKSTDIKDIIKESSCFFEFKKDNNIKGYTFCTLYKKSMVSSEFIQDFTCDHISLGSISQYHECNQARLLSKDYVYILGGYEKTCIYKCNFHGMEWWTGKEWSTNVDLYKKLCERDSRIKIENYDNNL